MLSLTSCLDSGSKGTVVVLGESLGLNSLPFKLKAAVGYLYVHRIKHDACALGAADSEALTAWLLMGGWKVIGRVLAAVISRSSPRTASTAKANS
jgi:hypothetical protein